MLPLVMRHHQKRGGNPYGKLKLRKDLKTWFKKVSEKFEKLD